MFNADFFFHFSSPTQSRGELIVYPRRRRPDWNKVFGADPESQLLLGLSSPNVHG